MRWGGCGDRYPATIRPRFGKSSDRSIHGDRSDTRDGPGRREREAGLPACTWKTRLMASDPDLSDSSQPGVCPTVLDTVPGHDSAPEADSGDECICRKGGSDPSGVPPDVRRAVAALVGGAHRTSAVDRPPAVPDPGVGGFAGG